MLEENLSQQPDPVSLILNRVRSSPDRLAKLLVCEWTQYFDALWSASGFYSEVTIEERLSALGTDAAKFINANKDFAEFLIALLEKSNPSLVGEIIAKLATIPKYVANENGSVKLVLEVSENNGSTSDVQKDTVDT